MRRLVLLTLAVLLPLAAQAAPKGFDTPSQRHAAPEGFNQNLYGNTIHGIREKASDGDYVLLQGRAKLEDDTLYLIDRNGDEIKVIPRSAFTIDKIYLSEEARWQMWGQVKKGLFDLHLDLISFSCDI